MLRPNIRKVFACGRLARYPGRRFAYIAANIKHSKLAIRPAEAYAARMSATLELLKKIQIFHGIHPRGLEAIAAICSEQHVATGDLVFREGDLGDKLYMILEGQVRISRDLQGMGEEALAILGPSSAFGEMALVDASPRSADARVHERARLLVLTKEALEELLFLDKELAYEILWNFVRVLSTRLRDTNDKMTFMSVSSKFQ